MAALTPLDPHHISASRPDPQQRSKSSNIQPLPTMPYSGNGYSSTESETSAVTSSDEESSPEGVEYLEGSEDEGYPERRSSDPSPRRGDIDGESDREPYEPRYESPEPESSESESAAPPRGGRRLRSPSPSTSGASSSTDSEPPRRFTRRRLMCPTCPQPGSGGTISDSDDGDCHCGDMSPEEDTESDSSGL